MFSVVRYPINTSPKLNNDLHKVSLWAYKWKHINEKINEANKGIGIIRKLNNILPRSALLTIYRSFIRPHLEYGDVIYDQPENESFSIKIESVQYNASLAKQEL